MYNPQRNFAFYFEIKLHEKPISLSRPNGESLRSHLASFSSNGFRFRSDRQKETVRDTRFEMIGTIKWLNVRENVERLVRPLAYINMKIMPRQIKHKYIKHSYIPAQHTFFNQNPSSSHNAPWRENLDSCWKVKSKKPNFLPQNMFAAHFFCECFIQAWFIY